MIVLRLYRDVIMLKIASLLFYFVESENDLSRKIDYKIHEQGKRERIICSIPDIILMKQKSNTSHGQALRFHFIGVCIRTVLTLYDKQYLFVLHGTSVLFGIVCMNNLMNII